VKADHYSHTTLYIPHQTQEILSIKPMQQQLILQKNKSKSRWWGLKRKSYQTTAICC